MKKTSRFLFLVFLLVFSAASGAPQNADDIQRLFNEAMSNYRERNFIGAIENFSAVIELNPSATAAYINRASAYRQIRNYRKAIEDLSRAIEIEPDNALAYQVLGNTYLYMEEYDKALQNLLKAVELSDGFVEALNSIGGVYYQKGELDKAVEFFTRAIGKKNDYAGAYNNRGLAFYYMGKNENAVTDFLTAIKHDPTLGEPYNNLGLVNLADGMYIDAIFNCTKAIGLNYREALVYNNRGNAYKALGDNERAIADYTTAITGDSTFAYAYNNRGIAYKNTGRYQEAISDYLRAIKIRPDYTDAWNNLGNVYALLGDNRKAIESYQSSLDAAVSANDINSIVNQTWHFLNRLYGRLPYLEGINNSSDNFNNDLALVAQRGIELSIEKTEEARHNLGARGTRIFDKRLPLYYAAIDLTTALNDSAQSFLYSESLRSRNFLEQFGSEAASRLPEISAEDREKLQEINSRISALRNILDSYDNKLPDKKYADTGDELSKAEEELALLDVKLSNVPRYLDLRKPKPIDVEEAKAWCSDDRAVLEYVIWDASIYTAMNTGSELLAEPPTINSYCLVLTKDGITPVKLDPDFKYTETVKALYTKLFTKNDNGTITPNEQHTFEDERNDLYYALIDPVLKHIPEGVQNLLIVPDSNLAYLPFDILRENSKAEKDLGERYNITLSPSVSISMFTGENEVALNEPIIAFGGVWYKSYHEGNEPLKITDDMYNRLADLGLKGSDTGEAPQGNERAEDFFRNRWNPLRGWVEEMQGLELIATEVRFIQGKEASMHRVKEMSSKGELRNYPIVHFSCHGYFNDDLIPQAALVLSEVSTLLGSESKENGYLSIEEIALLNLDAKMVMLSACQTGLGDMNKANGMSGMARAFMVAGAQNVGVSLWEINERATMEFMLKVYDKVIGGGKTFRDAYSEVKKEFRQNENWNHPYYWAAFTMYE